MQTLFELLSFWFISKLKYSFKNIKVTFSKEWKRFDDMRHAFDVRNWMTFRKWQHFTETAEMTALQLN